MSRPNFEKLVDELKDFDNKTDEEKAKIVAIFFMGHITIGIHHFLDDKDSVASLQFVFRYMEDNYSEYCAAMEYFKEHKELVE